MDDDHYKTLGIRMEASQVEIAEAFESIRARCGQSAASPLTFRLEKARKSFEILSDPVRRRAHDRWILQRDGRKNAPDVAPVLVPPVESNSSVSTAVWWVLGGLAAFVVLVMVSVPDGESPRGQPSTPGAELANSPAPSAQSGFVLPISANIRAEPSAKSAAIEQLVQLTEVAVQGSEFGWTKVGPLPSGRTGYIRDDLLSVGTYEAARAAVCGVQDSSRPFSGQIFSQTGRGPHQLTVNAGSVDTMVKLRKAGKTVLSFYVRAGESGQVSDVPEGEFQILFASGSQFGIKCLDFNHGMTVTADPNPVVFESTVQGDYVYYSTATYSLRQQANGNFQPSAVDESAFRE